MYRLFIFLIHMPLIVARVRTGVIFMALVREQRDILYLDLDCHMRDSFFYAEISETKGGRRWKEPSMEDL